MYVVNQDTEVGDKVTTNTGCISAQLIVKHVLIRCKHQHHLNVGLALDVSDTSENISQWHLLTLSGGLSWRSHADVLMWMLSRG